MSEIYENPPLIEALCEFKFDSNKEWDWTIPGLLYDKIKENFPNKKQQEAFVINLEHKENTKNMMTQVREGTQTDRIIFSNENNNSLIQVKPNVFTINLLKYYPGWEEFKKIINKYLKLYIKVAQPTKINRIGLRYINRFNQIDLNQNSISHYFKINPSMLEGYQIGNFFVRNEIIYNKIDSILICNMGSQNDGGNYIFLDFDFITQNSEYIRFENYQEWLEKAHENIEDVFNSSITNKLKNFFRGVE